MNNIVVNILIVAIVIFLVIYLEPEFKPVKAVCVLKTDNIDGTLYFEELSLEQTKIYGKITGLKPNSLQGIHIHESGDLTEGCTSACAHYNPFHKNHGGPNDEDRHVGDLGNLKTNDKGESVFELVDNLVKLRGQYSVIGRSIVIHEDPDDLGKGNFPDSHTTGHSGKRIACAIIGYAKDCK